MIALKDIGYKTEDGMQILQDINLEIGQGECVVIAGPSGSGKSTLGSVINGLIPHYYKGVLSGTVTINGNDTKNMTLCERGRIAGTVFQDPRSQFFMTDTFNEVAFGCTAMQLTREEIIARTENSFAKLKLEKLQHKSIFHLSSGERQKIAIASIYAMQPEIIIFDEPSANLGIDSIFDLQEILCELKREGKTVIVLEHRLFYLKDLFDRMIYVHKGRIEGVLSNAEAVGLSDEQRKRMKLRSFNPQCCLPCGIRNTKYAPDDRCCDFEIRSLSFCYGRKNASAPILSDISLKANRGDIIGIVGKNGMGKTTLAKLCAGLVKEHAGTITLDGTVLPAKKRLGTIYFVMQEADYQLFASTVYEELFIGTQRKNADRCQRETVLSQLELTEYKELHPACLSGGQKQRLTVACALLSNCPVIFFDEPTGGLDLGGMEMIAHSIDELSRNKKIIFIISHDYEFLISCCNRIIHIAEGRIKEDFMLTDTSALQLWNILIQKGNEHEQDT